MEKAGRNTGQSYNYLMESQVAEKFKELFEKHKVLFTYSSFITGIQPSPSGKQLITNVEVRYAFESVDTDERITGVAAGQGSDSTDKGVYKAITGAIKYIFMKTFLIPTGDDPEKDDKTTKSKYGTIGNTKVPYPSPDMGVPFGDEED